MSSFFNKPKSVITHDTSGYGEDLFIPFTCPPNANDAYVLTSVTVNASATEILGLQEDGFNSQAATPTEHQSVVMAINNTIGILSEGDNANFDETFTWTPDMNASVYKVSLILGAGVNVSAYTDGSVILGQISVSAIERQTGRVLIGNPDITINNVTTSLGATGTALEIIFADWTQGFRVQSKSPIDIRVIIRSTRAGTNTSQTGFFPIFPLHKLNVMKQWLQSGIVFHIHATADHADEALQWTPGRVSVLGQ
jgi:hypothetical protein